ncbi:coadhesin-like [Glandiceps talaboti]
MICNGDPCPVNGSWSEWSMWLECNKSCENGTQTRTRSCSVPAAAYGGYTCGGKVEAGEDLETESQFQSCNEHRCPIDGGFEEWGAWPDCPVTCGGQEIFRYRNCTNPVPAYNGKPCTGDDAQSQICSGDKQCPMDGQWGRWTIWTSCSADCEGGTQIRVRLCNSPSPLYGGMPCEGENRQSKSCNIHRCPVHGGWTLWTAWSKCSKPCDAGLKDRIRTCTNPAAQYGGQLCTGLDQEKKICNAYHCPVHGGYTVWSDWAECPVTCGGAVVNRTRVCTNPSPKHGGRDCEGPTQSSTLCAINHCPIDGSWTSWSEWSSCSVDCGGTGVHSAFRNCSDPPPQYNGMYCPGEEKWTYPCFKSNECPGLPAKPVNLQLAGIQSLTLTGYKYTVYLMWNDGNITTGSPADYYIIQAKRIQKAGLSKVNASHFQWQNFGSVHHDVQAFALRNRGEMELLSGAFNVRVKAVNKFGEQISKEELFQVSKYLMRSGCISSTSSTIFVASIVLITVSNYVL